MERKDLPEHPVSALSNMADWGWIPRAVYVGQPMADGFHYAMVAEIQGYGFRLAEGEDKVEAKRKAAEELLRHILATICPHPEKMRYATEEVAYRTVGRHLSTGLTGIQNAYECRCGWWHLTSRRAAA